MVPMTAIGILLACLALGFVISKIDAWDDAEQRRRRILRDQNVDATETPIS